MKDDHLQILNDPNATKDELRQIIAELVAPSQEPVARFDVTASGHYALVFANEIVREQQLKPGAKFYSVPSDTAAQIAGLNDDVMRLEYEKENLQEQIAKLETENQRYRAALERLAKLGNGDQYGNSLGNQLAREALRLTDEEYRKTLECATQQAPSQEPQSSQGHTINGEQLIRSMMRQQPDAAAQISDARIMEIMNEHWVEDRYGQSFNALAAGRALLSDIANAAPSQEPVGIVVGDAISDPCGDEQMWLIQFHSHLPIAEDTKLYAHPSDAAAQIAEYSIREGQLMREIAHWKANHDNRVEAARILIERNDLPFERVQAYKKHVELQTELAEAQSKSLDRNNAVLDQIVRQHVQIAKLEAAARMALDRMEGARLFVTSKEQIKRPEGHDWYDEAITALREVLE